jgi:ABC-type transport system substrate-binding protein
MWSEAFLVLEEMSLKTAQAILIIGIIIAAAGIGVYGTATPSKGKLTIDWWYESSGHYPQSADQAAVYKSQLEKTGLITVNLKSADWPSFRQLRNSRSMEVFVYGWYPDFIDADDYTYVFLHSVGSGFLHMGYNNTQMDHLLDEARRVTDPTQRAQYYHEAQQLMVQDAPVVAVFEGYGWAVTKSDVQGVNLDVTQNMYYWPITPPAGKDTLIIGTTDSVETSLDPAQLYDYFAGSELINNLGAPLVYIKPGSSAGPNDFVGAVAESWSIAPDGLTYTFNIRQNLKFYDGTPVDANAVKYSIDRNIHLANPSGPQVALAYSDMIDSVEVSGPYTVVIHMKFPFAPFMALLAFSGSFMVNPKLAPDCTTDCGADPGQAVQYTEGDARKSNPNDLGPYLLTEWSRKAGKDYEMKLDANPYYFDAANVKNKHVIIKFYSDATALASAVLSGDIDMAYRQLASSDIKSMMSNPSLKVWKGPGLIQYIVFQEAMPPFDNAKFRQAIAQLIDRNEIVNTVFQGLAVPLYSQIPNEMAFHEDAYKALPLDATPAITLLQAMGYTPTVENPNATYGLAVAVVGVVIFLAGLAMSRRKKS